MMQKIFFLLISLELIVILSKFSSGAKIFCIFSSLTNDRKKSALTLSHALAEKGHELTVVTTQLSEVKIENHQEIYIGFLEKFVKNMTQIIEYEEKGDQKEGEKKEKTGGVSNAFYAAASLPNTMELLNTKLYNSPEIKKIASEIYGNKYDLIIYEPLYLTSLLGMADYVGNPPTIALWTGYGVSSISKIFGNPVIPSYILSPSFNGLMSFWQRFENLFFELYLNYVTEYKIVPINEQFMHNFFGNTHRRLRELEYNTSLFIVATDFATSYVQPIQPNTIQVGPLHVGITEPTLPEDVKGWMDESEEGVIYFNLGSQLLEEFYDQPDIINRVNEVFYQIFDQFPKILVIWDWESEDHIAGVVKNIMYIDQLQQESILAHPSTRLLISRASESFEEAVHYGVPVLGVSVFDDQASKFTKILNAGAGLMADVSSATYDDLYEKINELLTNQSYQENMLRLSEITRDKPMTAIETATWWVEYVLRHKGAPHLRPAVLDLTWYQYFMLDILLSAAVITLIIVCIVYRMFILVKLIIMSFWESTPRQVAKVIKRTEEE